MPYRVGSQCTQTFTCHMPSAHTHRTPPVPSVYLSNPPNLAASDPTPSQLTHSTSPKLPAAAKSARYHWYCTRPEYLVPSSRVSRNFTTTAVCVALLRRSS
ncbi:hypothetical protein B0T16DRAFT_413585 [Cercophora newfieldiana]|uniref:Uncharacterized protein n=1 Tax=Cercophora newfieldiana TaxID=92897 RepID=A0AA39Y8L6_9PEZI|nr:hypothetical protein B0T16DRAFT_413585 [Cercophora newfieldiana]